MTLANRFRFLIFLRWSLGLGLILIGPMALACTAGQARGLVEKFFSENNYECQTSGVSERTNGIFSDDYYSVKFFCEGSPMRSQTMYVYIGTNQCYMK